LIQIEITVKKSGKPLDYLIPIVFIATLKNSQSSVAVPSFDANKDRSRIKLYYTADVQRLLKKITGRDPKVVFRKRKIGQKLREPKYVFMTDEEFAEAQMEAERKSDMLLQMPPVLAPREPINEELSFDPQIQGIETATLVFTDISMNVSNRVGIFPKCFKIKRL